VFQLQFGQHGPRRGDLPLAAVDEDQVGQAAFVADDPAIAAAHGLRKRRVIISRRDIFDVEPAIVRFQGTLRAKHHAGRDGCLAARMADIEALDAPGRLIQFEQPAQRFEAALLPSARSHAL
jgi:hypothetical protein